MFFWKLAILLKEYQFLAIFKIIYKNPFIKILGPSPLKKGLKYKYFCKQINVGEAKV